MFPCMAMIMMTESDRQRDWESVKTSHGEIDMTMLADRTRRANGTRKGAGAS